ncbi:MAG: Gfo/Idh/MocA family protein [Planctomycetota bacterium]|jgi:predicted dehydrogenase
MERIGFGLIGCGIWGSIHARTFAASPLVRFVGVCDLDKDRAEAFAKDYRAENSYTDWNELLANPEIKAVSVATPDFAHSAIVLAAIEAGKDVLVEKPLAMTIEECEKILAVRDTKNVKLMIDFQNRWNIPFIHVRNMVTSGELGDLLMMNIRLNDTIFVPTKMLSWASKSSPAHFLGSHIVDLIRWISGAEIKRVFSVSRSVVLKKRGIDTPDFYQSILELSNGGTAFVENCWIVAENAPNVYEFKCEFIGSAGSAYVDASHHRMIEKYTGEGAGFPDVTGAPDVYGKPVGFGIRPAEHFIECIAGNTTPMVTGEDGLVATKVVLAMEESVKTGLPVDLK